MKEKKMPRDADGSGIPEGSAEGRNEQEVTEMAISPIYLNGMISATPEIAAARHTDDARAALIQSSTEADVEEQADDKVHTVQSKDNADGPTAGFDASGKGSNEYAGDGGARRPGKKNTDGKVVVKNKGGFSISI